MVKVGHYFWILGGLIKEDWSVGLLYQEKTSVFSLRKMKWFDGPNLPEALIINHAGATMYCVTSLNQTTAIFIGVGETSRGMILYNFEFNSWTAIANTPTDIKWCSCSSSQGKDYSQ